MLSSTQSLTLNAILQDAIDKLQFLECSKNACDDAVARNRDRFVDSIGIHISEILQRRGNVLQLYERDLLRLGSSPQSTKHVRAELRDNSRSLRASLDERPDSDSNLKRVDQTRKFVMEILEGLRTELASRRSYSQFVNEIEQWKKIEKEQQNELDIVESLQIERLQLRKNIDTRRLESESRVVHTAADLSMLEELIRNVAKENRSVKEYISTMEQARKDAWECQMHFRELGLRNAAKKQQQKHEENEVRIIAGAEEVEHDIRVLSDRNKYLSAAISVLKEDIEMMRKHTEDLMELLVSEGDEPCLKGSPGQVNEMKDSIESSQAVEALSVAVENQPSHTHTSGE